MKKFTLLENADVSLYCYPELGVVHHVIHKFVYGDTFRNLMTMGADAFIEHGCTKWLSDDRSSAILRDEDAQWGQENWEHRILEKGWKYWALIMPEKIAGQLNTKKLIERYTGMGLDVRTFEKDTEAMDWLSSI